MHHEKKVSERLSKMGIDSFVPVQQQIHQWSDRRKLVVVKNTLLGKALEKVEKADADLVKVLEGPTSIMFTNVAKAPAVLIKEFRKKSEKPVLKAAFAEGCVYVGDDQLDALCNIKSKEELIADIVALLQSPAKNVISALQANAGQKIAGLVKTLESRNN